MSARVLVGGVGYRWMGDASFGLVVGDELARLDWPPNVTVADLGYGAVYVAMDPAEAKPRYERLLLLAANERGRAPGRLYRYRWRPRSLDPDDVQARIREAGAGVIDLDHLLVIAQHFNALPDEVVVFEIEPVDNSVGEQLSPQVAELLPQVVSMVRQEALSASRPAAPTA